MKLLYDFLEALLKEFHVQPAEAFPVELLEEYPVKLFERNSFWTSTKLLIF